MGSIKLLDFDSDLKRVVDEMNNYPDRVCWALNPAEVQRASKDVKEVNTFVQSLSDSDIEVLGTIVSSDTCITYYLSMFIAGLYVNDADIELFGNFTKYLTDNNKHILMEPRVGNVFEWAIDSYELIQMNYVD